MQRRKYMQQNMYMKDSYKPNFMVQHITCKKHIYIYIYIYIHTK